MPAFFSHAALRDLENIITFVARSSPQNADALVQRVEGAVQKIARAPSAYPVRDDLPFRGLRTKHEPPCIIVYRISTGGVAEVMRIAHGAQDLAAFLLA